MSAAVASRRVPVKACPPPPAPRHLRGLERPAVSTTSYGTGAETPRAPERPLWEKPSHLSLPPPAPRGGGVGLTDGTTKAVGGKTRTNETKSERIKRQ